MNLTSSISSIVSHTNSTGTESWFIPVDILMIICTILVIILATLFVLIIIFDKTCHTISMMLISNSCLTAIVLGCISFSLSLFTLENDIKQIYYEDSFCAFRAYMNYALSAAFMFSFLLQAFYRYIVVVYRTHLFLQSIKLQLLLISLTWIFSFTYPLVIIFTDRIIYNIDNQICQLPLRLSFSLIFGAFCIYIIPVSMTMFIYIKLILYVKELRHHMIIVNTLSRAQRELKMVQRIVTLINIIMTIGIPYGIFIFISFFTTPPKYHFRIAFVFVDASLLSVMIVLLQFTDPLRKSIMKRLSMRPNAIAPGRPY
ncbi:unnamed protein product [Adineta steineri]|uniref:G-protein coupled receptors family 1 profile domain-containing protein n=1 Tax=Adineta steineri TaxID=433720 RepID=A0A815SYZ9_9BILA|nr:unnamed protein product [Adineta steineri]CAF1643667.1 unnamed protein product [Adineta steineri]